MQVIVKIDIDNEAAREFNRQAETKTAGNVAFLDFLEDGIRGVADRIDEFSHVDVLLKRGSTINVDFTKEDEFDLWYGKCLRVADELGVFNQAVKEMGALIDVDALKIYHGRLAGMNG